MNAIHLKLSMVRIRNHPEWLPGCTIELADAGARNMLAIKLLSPERQNGLTFQLQRWADKKEIARAPINVAAAVGDRFDILLAWSASGVAITINGDSFRPQPLAWRVASVSLSGSTGECKFEPVEFGHAGA